jgi:hypothetical protein
MSKRSRLVSEAGYKRLFGFLFNYKRDEGLMWTKANLRCQLRDEVGIIPPKTPLSLVGGGKSTYLLVRHPGDDR